MKIETQRHDNCTLALTVEVEDERVQPALRAAARQIAKRYAVPGFRPGKAPYDVILRQFGEGALYEAALEDLGKKIYAEAIKQAQVDAYGPGSLDDVQLKPMVLKFTVPLRPEVDLGDYRALRVPYTPPSISEEAVKDALEHLREHHAIIEPVDRAAALGDVAVLDVKGYVHEGLNPSDFLMTDHDVALMLDEKSDWPVPGFAPLIVGMRAGDEKKFDLTFPEDYPNESLRGQVGHFEVQCKDVKSRRLPDWSDELAKEIGDYQNLEDLRAKVQAELRKQAEAEVEQEYGRQAVDRLVEQVTVKYPPALLEEELDDMLEDLDRRLREQRLTLDDYLKIEAKTKESLREEYKPQAERRLKRALVLGKVVELEKLDVSQADVEQQITQLSARFGENADRMRQVLSSDRARRSLSLDLLTNKAVKWLAALARGEAVPLPEEPIPAAVEGEAESQAAPAAPASA